MLLYFWSVPQPPFLPSELSNIDDQTSFENAVKETYAFQREYCAPYKRFCNLLKTPMELTDLSEIPFLPVDFFKIHDITSADGIPEKIFSSSGTTGATPSKHLVHDLSYYNYSLDAGFNIFYGSLTDYTVLALLPHYLEREGSSLVDMAARWIEGSKDYRSGFYLHDLESLHKVLCDLASLNRKTILLGVTFALLKLAEKFSLDFPELTIIETGGMKGMYREMVRDEVHSRLRFSFRESEIHSEYGMTELLSQAYLQKDGLFKCPPWMRISIRNTYDPRSNNPLGRTGGINVIDLANQTSCSFIATQDLGKLHEDGFEVLGRFDQSQIRGCNLMVTGF